MREEYVSFETALLAKEKGFRNRTTTFYWPEDGEFDEITYCHCDFEILNKCECGHDELWNKLSSGELVEAPTQSLLQKWLREKHNLHVNPSYNHVDNNGSYMVWFFKQNRNVSDVWYDGYSSYEQAFEAGLVRALNMIK